MSDTDEFPAVKTPVPPAELWAIWDIDKSRWVDAHDVAMWDMGAMLWFPSFADAESAIAEIDFPDGNFVPVRLIPPTP